MAIYFNGVNVTDGETSGAKFAVTTHIKRMNIGGGNTKEFTLDISSNVLSGFSVPFVTFWSK